VRFPIRRLHRDLRGQALVEFAVTLPIWLLLMLGVIYFGKAFYKEQQVQIAARYVAWKTGRHDETHNLGTAVAQANNVYSLDGASISGSFTNGSLQLLSGDNFNPTIFTSLPDPGGLPNPMSFFNYSQIATMVASGIAQVDDRYQARVDQPMGTSLLPFLGNYTITRRHEVLIGNWDYEEIEGDVVLFGYEAYLDAWAYDEIYGLCSWCI